MPKNVAQHIHQDMMVDPSQPCHKRRQRESPRDCTGQRNATDCLALSPLRQRRAKRYPKGSHNDQTKIRWAAGPGALDPKSSVRLRVSPSFPSSLPLKSSVRRFRTHQAQVMLCLAPRNYQGPLSPSLRQARSGYIVKAFYV